MTRKEQILTACKGFLAAYPNIDQAGLSIGFLDGAVWSDKNPVNVWHNVSEEPKINEDVVLYDCCGNFIAEFFDGSVTWRNIVLYYKATMWAYADDLLPKGDKK